MKWLRIIAIGCYLLSMGLVTYTEVESQSGWIDTFRGYQVFALCLLAIISLPQYFIAWLANPAFVISFFLRSRPGVQKIAATAAVLFSLVPLADLYREGLLAGLRAGYYLWVGSFMLQLTSCLLRKDREK